jgi:hypothetical protein
MLSVKFFSVLFLFIFFICIYVCFYYIAQNINACLYKKNKYNMCLRPIKVDISLSPLLAFYR